MKMYETRLLLMKCYFQKIHVFQTKANQLSTLFSFHKFIDAFGCVKRIAVNSWKQSKINKTKPKREIPRRQLTN